MKSRGGDLEDRSVKWGVRVGIHVNYCTICGGTQDKVEGAKRSKNVLVVVYHLKHGGD